MKVLRKKLRYTSAVFAVAGAVTLMPLTAQAILIDFETIGGMTPTEGQAVGTEGIATFGVGAGSTPTGTGFIAQLGDPVRAFNPSDTPNPATNAGSFFLTDESSAPPSSALNYFIGFSAPVANLSLDLYDYLSEDGPPVGSTATLTVYSDVLGGTAVGSDMFIVSSGLPDGNVVTLSILSPLGSIRAASLIFSSGDPGTGIDNINFNLSPIPEPSTLLLLGVGLAGTGFVSRRRFRTKNGY